MAEIRLNDGKIVRIDDEDAVVVSKLKWFWHPNKCPASSCNKKTILLPRLVTGAPCGSICRYKTEDRLDNRKSNIVVQPRKISGIEVHCACGCGTVFNQWRKNGRRPIYVNGHNGRKSWEPDRLRKTRKRWAEANPASVVRSKRQHYRRRKLRAMAVLGNCCADCSTRYNGTNAPIFEFDHLNPAEKKTIITRLLSNCSWAKVLVELKKCQLLCANCHNQKHGGKW